MNSYDLSRNFWNWAFDNPEKINPSHAAIYFFAIEHCNRLGWKEKFGLPSYMTMEAIGIKKHQTYSKYFNDLIEYKFFNLIEKSKNQYSSNIISLVNAMPKNGQALDKANIKHRAKLGSSLVTIDKQKNKEQRTKRQSFSPPNILEVIEYFNEKGYTEEAGKKAFEFYAIGDWKDSRGNKVKNWKQKMLSVWFKPENKQASVLTRAEEKQIQLGPYQ